MIKKKEVKADNHRELFFLVFSLFIVVIIIVGFGAENQFQNLFSGFLTGSGTEVVDKGVSSSNLILFVIIIGAALAYALFMIVRKKKP